MAADIGRSVEGEDDFLEESSLKPIVYSSEVEEAISQVFQILLVILKRVNKGNSKSYSCVINFVLGSKDQFGH